MAINYDDFRADIGDTNNAFSDDDIDRLETRAVARWNDGVSYEGARVMAVQQLVANSAKFSDYTANESSEKKSQVFKQLKDLLGIYQADLVTAQAGQVTSSNVRMGNTRRKPPRRKEYPDA